MNSEEDICRDLVAALPDGSWKWDGRFGAVLAEFRVADQAGVRDVLQRLFGAVWDGDNIDIAPDAVRAVKSHFGGLMPGQLLFTSDPGRAEFICCAWWPWGNGQTISLRLALFPGESLSADRIDQFKARFGI